ncbi:MAG: NYN domain-containing protein [Candidatus Brennerbacteria bacterium]|nr:NYN domain-containing protein [Candidatus Brennerbacteria bacterium]
MEINEKAHPSQRVGIFIDVQNIYHSAKNLFNSRVNFKELLKTLIADRPLIRAMAYVVKSETALGEESFFEALRKTGLELRLKDLLIFSGGAKKADWDVGLAVDAIRMASALDVVILVTGDGDFVPLVEYLKWGLGKQVEVAAFSRTTSSRLRESADTFIEIENIPRVLLKIRKRRVDESRKESLQN